MDVETYQDDQQIYAKVNVNGREIRLRSTPESDAFLRSLIDLDDAEELLGAALWLRQKVCACVDAPELLKTDPVAIEFQGRTITPFSTPEAEQFARGLPDVPDRIRLRAIGLFLHLVADQLFLRAVERNSDLLAGRRE